MVIIVYLYLIKALVYIFIISGSLDLDDDEEFSWNDVLKIIILSILWLPLLIYWFLNIYLRYKNRKNAKR